MNYIQCYIFFTAHVLVVDLDTYYAARCKLIILTTYVHDPSFFTNMKSGARVSRIERELGGLLRITRISLIIKPRIEQVEQKMRRM
jgi:hypothetical protein